MRLLLLLMLLVMPSVLAAQTVTSPGPDKVSVTVYRAPYRGADDRMELQWLQGYALITETRTVSIPAGEAVIRFEGVAGGILPESAIVTGLPRGVREKNQDAQLLSPRGLLAASTERQVTIRRTSRATGAVTEEDAILRSGPDGAIVMQTRGGFEALQCTGLNETLVYDSAPVGLSPKPTLSVVTESETPATATITLSYLAQGFDWQANYVATLAPDSSSLDLFAWVTLANGDETSFVDADTQAVAGKINREDTDDLSGGEPSYIQLRCWPFGNTGVPGPYGVAPPPPSPPPPPPPPMMAPMAEAQDIVVTGGRVSRQAVQEELGDLKLYRIPQPVTVASNSQKQVAMIDAERVPADIIYRARIADEDVESVKIVVSVRNRKENRLGMPLPAGPVAFFQPVGGRPVLLGESAIEDKAVGELVEIDAPDAPNVTVDYEDGEEDAKGARTDTVTVHNANARPIQFEAELTRDEERRWSRFSQRVIERDGKTVWALTVPSNGSATLSWRSIRIGDGG